jgi:hypothetical protein
MAASPEQAQGLLQQALNGDIDTRRGASRDLNYNKSRHDQVTFISRRFR